MNRRAVLAGALAAGCGLALGAPWVLSRRTPGITPLRGQSMGTFYTVKFPEDAGPAGPLHEEIQAVLARIDALMSTYKVDSELSLFNAAASVDWMTMSADTHDVVTEAVRVGHLTRGAFDITVGPLVDLWGFGAAPRTLAIPRDEALADAASAVDYQLLSSNGPSLRKSSSAVQVELSGIAKGYAVDRVAAVLEGHGVADYLVDIGGELRTRGRKPDGRRWRVGIERPDPDSRTVFRAVELGDRAIATSGDYRNFFVHEGRRYSHTIDPRTGRPVTHQLRSVSVIADTAMTADGLSTAIMVLGPHEGYEFARSHHLAASLIVHQDDGFDERWTPEFEPYRVG